MSGLSKIFIFKIVLTLGFWSLPLILMPAAVLELIGFPSQPTYMFVRLLGWAYLALCVGYGFGLQASLKGQRHRGPIWMGIVSNGGSCIYLFTYGILGAWDAWSISIRLLLWGSALATAAIAIGLFVFGVLER